jgi:hypothetical protein
VSAADTARQHLAEARTILEHKSGVGAFALDQTAAGQLLLALEAFFGPSPAPPAAICDAPSPRLPRHGPLSCGHPEGHDGPHSWQPTDTGTARAAAMNTEEE